jgi:hypothetical protein
MDLELLVHDAMAASEKAAQAWKGHPMYWGGLNVTVAMRSTKAAQFWTRKFDKHCSVEVALMIADSWAESADAWLMLPGTSDGTLETMCEERILIFKARDARQAAWAWRSVAEWIEVDHLDRFLERNLGLIDDNLQEYNYGERVYPFDSGAEVFAAFDGSVLPRIESKAS